MSLNLVSLLFSFSEIKTMKKGSKESYGDLYFYEIVVLNVCETLKSYILKQCLWLARNQPYHGKKIKSRRALMNEVIPRSGTMENLTPLLIDIYFSDITTLENIDEVAMRLRELDTGVIRYHLSSFEILIPVILSLLYIFSTMTGYYVRPSYDKSITDISFSEALYRELTIATVMNTVCVKTIFALIDLIVRRWKNRF